MYRWTHLHVFTNGYFTVKKDDIRSSSKKFLEKQYDDGPCLTHPHAITTLFYHIHIPYIQHKDTH